MIMIKLTLHQIIFWKMGNDISVAGDINIIDGIRIIDIKEGETCDRGCDSIREELSMIKSKISTKIEPNPDTGLLLVIFCNSYTNTSLDLGDSACNDGILMYNRVSDDYGKYLFHDIPMKNFVELFKSAISTPAKKCIIYFIGHGKLRKDKVKHKQVQSLVFKPNDEYPNDKLFWDIKRHKKCDELYLIADCCHSEGIFGAVDSDSITCMSSCKTQQKAKQNLIERDGHGVFTFYLGKYWLDEGIYEIPDLVAKINNEIKIYNHQECTVSKKKGTLKP